MDRDKIQDSIWNARGIGGKELEITKIFFKNVNIGVIIETKMS